MILIQKLDELTKVAISTMDMIEEPTEMTISSVQTKDTSTLKMVNTRTYERCGIYQFYAVGSEGGYRRFIRPLPREIRDEFDKFGHTTYNDTVYFNSFVNGSTPVFLGTYDYVFGSEIGLMQIGVPTLEKVEYQHSPAGSVYYEG